MYNNKIGVIYQLSDLLKEKGEEILFELGLDCVQIQCWDDSLLTEENAEKAKAKLGDKIKISSFWCGWSGPAVWDFIDGPYTLGLVPEAYRGMRIKELKKGADFAVMLGSPNLVTHVGFIPEQPECELYRGVISAVKNVASYCKDRGLGFNFETGQETPVTLMRAINDIGLDNLGINLDPSNIILYGKGNPVDAVSIFCDKIKGVHVKDGDYPTGTFRELGKERVVGEGTVNYPVFLPKLLENGYEGDLYIEREISGDQQIIDIKKTITYVKEYLNK